MQDQRVEGLHADTVVVEIVDCKSVPPGIPHSTKLVKLDMLLLYGGPNERIVGKPFDQVPKYCMQWVLYPEAAKRLADDIMDQLSTSSLI